MSSHEGWIRSVRPHLVRSILRLAQEMESLAEGRVCARSAYKGNLQKCTKPYDVAWAARLLTDVALEDLYLPLLASGASTGARNRSSHCWYRRTSADECGTREVKADTASFDMNAIFGLVYARRLLQQQNVTQ